MTSLKSVTFYVLLLAAQYNPAHAQNLQSGPMVGYSDVREVMLWVQTKSPGRVRFEYWETSTPQVRLKTPEVETRREQACTAHIVADEVVPGSIYGYELFIDGNRVALNYPLRFQTQPVWRWVKGPTTSTIAIGSCAYINDTLFDATADYGSTASIFTSISQKRPDAMLWLGDNIYLRDREWNSRTGILKRYTHVRSLPILQPLLAATHHYAIWDDHDFGPNDFDRGWWNKSAALEGFRLFWANPSYGLEEGSGITTTFEWADAQFFLLDNRWFRTPNGRRTGGQHTLLGKRQRDWLIDALVSSQAKFKFVAAGGQFLNPAPAHETWANCAPIERMEILDTLAKERVEGVIFLSGDRHHTELSRLDRRGLYPLYDLTVSPLTSGVHLGGKDEVNHLRVENSFAAERNFGLLTFSGPTNDRSLNVSIRSESGDEIWQRQIRATELKNELTTSTR